MPVPKMDPLARSMSRICELRGQAIGHQNCLLPYISDRGVGSDTTNKWLSVENKERGCPESTKLAGNGALWSVELFHSPCKESIPYSRLDYLVKNLGDIGHYLFPSISSPMYKSWRYVYLHASPSTSRNSEAVSEVEIEISRELPTRAVRTGDFSLIDELT